LTSNNKFQEFSNTDRIWAIGSLHSSIESFQSIKKYIVSSFNNGAALLFLGDLIGYNHKSKEIITDVLSLRFSLMAKFNLDHEDIVFLRGAQEEMFSKLLQLQIAPNPKEIIDWIFSHGVDQTLVSYDFEPDQFRNIATQGTIQINKLTSKLNKKIK
jgi:serine/threonine protein phosphatase 1